MYLNSAGKLPQKSGTGSFTVKANLNEIQCDLFKGKKNLLEMCFFILCVYSSFSVLVMSLSKGRRIKAIPLLRSQRTSTHEVQNIYSLALAQFLISS